MQKEASYPYVFLISKISASLKAQQKLGTFKKPNFF